MTHEPDTRDRGTQIRDTLSLEELETIDEPIKIVFPEQVTSFTSGFFQALFGQSVRNLGEVKFRRVYDIQVGHNRLKADIEEGIRNAQNLSSPL